MGTLESPGRVTLLTDFGLRDPYVAIMKGVMVGICPRIQFVDITHDIAPQAVAEGARILAHSWSWFPPGTLHLAVVDPGVGTTRRPLVVEAGSHIFVGPDNGILSGALQRPGACAFELKAEHYRLPRVSATFHGRDIFAPAVAWLARGVPASEMGDPVWDALQLNLSVARMGPEGGVGEVVHVDNFGNLITNIRGEDAAAWLGKGGKVTVGGEVFTHLARTYAEAGPGELLLLVDSNGDLEVAVRGGSAAQKLGVVAGGVVACVD